MSLWVVTSYFNPAGYRRRRENYRVFRRRLNAPLAAVELSFHGEFELQPGDADILIQRDGGDVLWQKERLLNIALEHLPGGCETVAWVDCDAIFDNDDWAERTLEALGRFRLVQVFSERHDLGAGVGEDEIRTAENRCVSGSLGHAIETGRIHSGNLPNQDCRHALQVSMGLGSACRVEDLREHSLYDAGIVGGGSILNGTACWRTSILQVTSRSAPPDAGNGTRRSPRCTERCASSSGPAGKTTENDG